MEGMRCMGWDISGLGSVYSRDYLRVVLTPAYFKWRRMGQPRDGHLIQRVVLRCRSEAHDEHVVVVATYAI